MQIDTPPSLDAPASFKSRAVRPVDAASLVLLDGSGRRRRVLMGRRHQGHRFMPGCMVFPGGRVEACDRSMAASGVLAAHTERALLARTMRPSASRARALALCCIRETFEETGLMVGESGLGAPPSPPAGWQAFADQGVYPILEGLHFVARAVTPPGYPRRFDTRFFAADAALVATRLEGIVGPESELVETMWLTFEQALALDLAGVTRSVIEELSLRIASGLERDMPVPYFLDRRGRWSREEV